MQDIRFNCRFTDIMRTMPSGDRLVDFRGFNSVTQNTIMPVPFGLSFAETVAINGPGVEPASQKSTEKMHSSKVATKRFSSKIKRSKAAKGSSGVNKSKHSDPNGQIRASQSAKDVANDGFGEDVWLSLIHI